MRYIFKNKNKQPKSLIRHKQKSHSDYDNYKEKDDLRKVLVEEQGHLCCYCMQRIKDFTAEKMVIEHFKPQSKYPELQLEYSNLFASCKGGENGPKHLFHCDKSKKESEIALNPSNQNLMSKIKFSSIGEIYTGDKRLDDELDNILRLNIPTFRNEREYIIKGIEQRFLKQFGNKPPTKTYVNEQIKKFSKNKMNVSERDFQVAIYHLEQKLNMSL